MYTSKGYPFSSPVYEARVLLAGLDYNHHVHRPAMKSRDGALVYVIRLPYSTIDLQVLIIIAVQIKHILIYIYIICCVNLSHPFRYRKVWNKKSRRWSLYTIKVPKDYSYIPDLQSAILRRWLTDDKGMSRKRRLCSSDAEFPAVPGTSSQHET